MTNDIKLLLTKLNVKLSKYAHYAANEWDMQWTLTLVAALAVILFILREKPLTNLIIWCKNWLVRFAKWFWHKLKTWTKGFHFVRLSPKLKRFSQRIDGISALKFGRYNRPHYLTLSWDSQFSSLVEGMHNQNEDDLQLEDSRVDEQGLNNWYIFDKACVFDFEDPTSVIDELQSIRPERPLDGVILCLSANALKHSDRRTLELHATKFHKQLWQLQIKYKFVLPIYLMITDTEQLTGFQEFWHNPILKPHHQELLGWSNPHEKCHDFDKLWITDGFASLCHQLRCLQRKLLSSDKPSLELLLFPQQLASLQKPMEIFCEGLFNQSSFHHSFMFRGFYFSGTINEAITPELEEQAAKEPDSQLFVKDFFVHKVFAEANIAFAPVKQVFSSDKKLRLFQYLGSLSFILLSTWLGFELTKLNKQSSNLATSIVVLQNEQDTIGLHDNSVNQALEGIAKMDASNLFYWSIPATWAGSFDHKLMDYFAYSVFGDRVFPTMNCMIEQRIADKVRSLPNTAEFEVWVSSLLTDYQQRYALHHLMLSNNSTKSEVKTNFNLLVDEILQKKLPNSFNQHADIYFEAIRSVSYQTSAKDCATPVVSNEDAQKLISARVGDFIAGLRHQVAAPQSFFEQIQKLESLPVNNSETRDFYPHLEKYLSWAKRMDSNWFGHSQNKCDRITQGLESLNQQLLGRQKDYIQDFKSRCNQLVKEQLNQDKDLLQPKLYDEGPAFSTQADELQLAMMSLTKLSFIDASSDANLNRFTDDFYWSVENLNHALAVFNEYKIFAEANYPALTPQPNRGVVRGQTQVGQTIALKQLEQAMRNAISRARIEGQLNDSYRPVNQQEAKVASYLGNFNEVTQLLLDLHKAFVELKFDKTNSEFLALTHDHAFKLLQQVDKLYRQSRLYQPLEEPFWGAHQYTRAMFGIASEGQLKDYLASQSGRVEFLSYNYVEPLLVFLRDTQAKAKPSHYQLFSRWENTLIELNKKQQLKDASNSQTSLEDFFQNQLVLTDQSNCFKQGKDYLQPQGNNLFAIAQRNIVSRAKALCQSYTAEQIVAEYQALFDAFTERLANRYPFTRGHNTRPASPKEIKDFLALYAGKSTGLAKRMEILQWSKREAPEVEQQTYQNATQFVYQLDQALDFFASAITALEAGNQAGLQLNMEFDVLPEQAQQVDHITQWDFAIGNQSFHFPSNDDSSEKTAIWRPKQKVSMQLHWAKNSPYQATPVNGESKLHRLVYPSDGVWSLLSFIDRYQSDIADNEALSDAAILLNFTAKLNTPSDNGTIENAIALARLTLFGPDQKTKQLKAISLPKSFPDHAPSLSPTLQGTMP